MGALMPCASVVFLTWLSISPVDAALSAAASTALYQNGGAPDCAAPAPLLEAGANCVCWPIRRGDSDIDWYMVVATALPVERQDIPIVGPA